MLTANSKRLTPTRTTIDSTGLSAWLTYCFGALLAPALACPPLWSGLCGSYGYGLGLAWTALPARALRSGRRWAYHAMEWAFFFVSGALLLSWGFRAGVPRLLRAFMLCVLAPALLGAKIGARVNRRGLQEFALRLGVCRSYDGVEQAVQTASAHGWVMTIVWCSDISSMHTLFIAIPLTLVTALGLARWFGRAVQDGRARLMRGLGLWSAGLLAYSGVTFTALPLTLPWAFPGLCALWAGMITCQDALPEMRQCLDDVLAYAQAPISDRALRPARALALGHPLAVFNAALFLVPQNGFQGMYALLLAFALPWVLLIRALWRAARYPLDAVCHARLLRLLDLREQGARNEPLERVMEKMLITSYARPFGLRVLSAFIRAFFGHRVLGTEWIEDIEEGNAVVLCNHSSLYGPIAAHLFLPYPARPWSDYRVVDRSLTALHIFEFTISRMRWIPKVLQWPISDRLLAPLVHWVMVSLNSLPVYRDDPRALIKTFRLSIDALRAGEVLLIFPENPNDPSLDSPHYVKVGVGPLFPGFALLAPLFYQQTGQSLRFVPMYASKRTRTVRFGQPIVYNPESSETFTQAELSDAVHERMVELALEAGDVMIADGACGSA